MSARNLLTVALALATLQAAAALAQNFPARPVTVIVPLETGGPTDLLARSLGKAFAERTGQGFVVENRPGASGVVGGTACAKAKPDGYTLCMLPRDVVAIIPFQETLPFDPVRDLQPVTNLLMLQNVIVVHPSLPVKDFRELVDYSRSHPGKLNYTAFATAQSIMQWIMNQTGMDMTFVPFKGGPSAMQAFLGGQIQVMYLAVGNPGLLAQIRAGRMRALAMPSRSRLLPDVPSFADVGMPKFGLQSWIGMFAPAGAPKDAIARLNGELSAIVRNPEFHNANMVPLGFDPVGNTAEEFARFLGEDRRDGAELAKLAGQRLK